MILNERILRLIITLAEELHFGRAAARLHLSQPALSGTVKSLEGELGVRLFRRDQRNVELTAAGQVFVGIMQLLRHSSPQMTLAYLKVTRPDLQREYRAALVHARHLVPLPRLPLLAHTEYAGLPTLLDSLRAAQHVLEMFRRAVTDHSTRRLLNRLGNRLIKIMAELAKIGPAE